MASFPAHPLTEQHLDQINTALEHVRHGKHQAKLATMAGIDVTEQARQLDAMHDQLQKIKQVYFPGR